MTVFAERGVPPHIARRAAAHLLEAARGRGRVAIFEPFQHPRNALGQFADKIANLHGRQRIELPDGTRVQRDANGTYRVVRRNRIARGYTSPAAAAADALNRSARSADPGSLGGSSFSSYVHTIPIRAEEQLRDITDNDLLHHALSVEPDVLSANQATDRYERRRARPAKSAQRILHAEIGRRGLGTRLADLRGQRGGGQPGAGPTTSISRDVNEAVRRQWVERHLAVNSSVAGTRIIENGVNGDYVWARGDDGRIWSIKIGGVDGVGTVRMGELHFNARNTQVRSVGFDGSSYSAPAMEQHLAHSTNGIAETIIGSQPILSGIVHPPMNRPTTAQPTPTAAPAPPAPVDHVGALPAILSQSSGHATPLRARAIAEAIHGFSADGYTAKITQYGQLTFTGTVIDSEGRAVGRFSRSFESTTKVYHGSFTMDEPHRGSGFGTKFIQHSFDAYKDNGFTTVGVGTANIGRYQWAKQGFGFSPGSDRVVFNHIRDVANGTAYYNVASAGDPQREAKLALLDELVRQIDEGTIKTPAQIAAFGRRTSWEFATAGPQGTTKQVKMWLGKWLLLQGPGWNGIKKL